MVSDIVKEREKYQAMLQIALAEARTGLAEGGIPIGAALFTREGQLLGKGHNRRVQEGDPSAHGETDAFRRAGRQRTYRDKIMVTTLAPCWYCSGLIRQFGIGTVIWGIVKVNVWITFELLAGAMTCAVTVPGPTVMVAGFTPLTSLSEGWRRALQ